MTRQEEQYLADSCECRARAEISNLAAALSALQGEIEDAKKESKAHAYMYADLPTVLQIARPLLSKHGLAVTQFPINQGDRVGVKTRLMHTSGEWLEDSMTMPVHESRGMSPAQAAGSVITYCRRYSLTAVLGISQEDDDAAPKQSTKSEDLDL